MKRKRLFNCSFAGHLVDPDWPVNQSGVKNNTSGKFHVYTLARCLRCGGFFSSKAEAPEPSGLVTATGAPAPLVIP